MKKHYAKYPRKERSACGLSKWGGSGRLSTGEWVDKDTHYLLETTRIRERVTCKNCKRTKRFREVK